MNKKILSSILLLIVATIWGLSFTVVSNGMTYIGTFTFSAIRGLIASLIFFLFMSMYPKLAIKKKSNINQYTNRKLAFVGGTLSGILFFINVNIHQVGISLTTSGKAGFITTLYIVLVPIIDLFFGEKVDKKTVICIITATIGFYFLSINNSFSISKGDFLVFIAAILISFQIALLGKYSRQTNVFELNFYQFFSMSILSLICAFIFEDTDLSSVMLALPAILYMSILSSFVAFSLQIYAFRHLGTTISMLICSVESIIAVLGGYIFLGELLTSREIIGCIIVFLSILVAQLPVKIKE